MDPKRHQFAIFEQSSVVLALYPQTTCFYKGVVESPPYTPDDSYLITFEDEEYENGHPPAVNVSQRFVLNYREKPVEVKSVCVELSDSSETDEETPEPAPQPVPIRRKFKVRDSDDVNEPGPSRVQRESSHETYESYAEDEEGEEMFESDGAEEELAEDGSGYESEGGLSGDADDERDESIEEPNTDNEESVNLDERDSRSVSIQPYSDDGSEELGEVQRRSDSTPSVSLDPPNLLDDDDFEGMSRSE